MSLEYRITARGDEYPARGGAGRRIGRRAPETSKNTTAPSWVWSSRVIPVYESHHLIGWILGKVHFPEPSLTIIAKGTYDLRHGSVATPSAEPMELSGDIHHDGDPACSLRYATDFAHFKPRADILIAGHCYAPGGKPSTVVRAAVEVGAFSKAIAVIGDRCWQRSLLGSAPSDPIPFTRMELRHERSFGGPRFKNNPLGKGMEKLVSDDGTQLRPLPNLEDPVRLIKSPKDRPDPAAFTPIPITWPPRMKKAGTYKGKWLKERWPWFAKDLDWTFFNAAPEDQQLEGYLTGNELLRLKNLHPEHSILECRLPGIRVRAFYAEVIGAPVSFQEVPMKLDTLWVDTDAARLVLVWRGVLDLSRAEPREADHVLVACEDLAASPLPEAHYAERLRRRILASPEVEVTAVQPVAAYPAGEADTELEGETPEETVEEEEPLPPDAASVEALLAAGIPAEEATAPPAEPPALEGEPPPELDLAPDDVPEEEEEEEPPAPEAPPVPETIEREWCIARLHRGESFDEQDLTGVDLSDLDLAGASFRDTILTGANLRRARLGRTALTGAILAGAALTDADLHEADLAGADLQGARLVRADLRGARLEGADLSEALLRRADLRGANAAEAIFSSADLTRADLRGANLTGAVMDACKLHRADLSGADLTEASLESAAAYPLAAARARLARMRASGAVLWQADLREVEAPESVWEQADLRGANLAGSDLTRAEMEGANLAGALLSFAVLRGARLPKAQLRGARLFRADLLSGSLADADLDGADLTQANLFNVEFRDATLERAVLEGANLKRTDLARS